MVECLAKRDAERMYKRGAPYRVVRNSEQSYRNFLKFWWWFPCDEVRGKVYGCLDIRVCFRGVIT